MHSTSSLPVGGNYKLGDAPPMAFQGGGVRRERGQGGPGVLNDVSGFSCHSRWSPCHRILGRFHVNGLNTPVLTARGRTQTVPGGPRLPKNLIVCDTQKVRAPSPGRRWWWPRWWRRRCLLCYRLDLEGKEAIPLCLGERGGDRPLCLPISNYCLLTLLVNRRGGGGEGEPRGWGWREGWGGRWMYQTAAPC